MGARSFALGAVAGAIFCFGAFLVMERASARDTNFSTLVRDIHVATAVGRVSRAATHVPSEHVAADLNIIFQRYSNFDAGELAILRVVYDRVQGGTVVLPEELSRELQRRLGNA